jgi:hypothetical protein
LEGGTLEELEVGTLEELEGVTLEELEGGTRGERWRKVERGKTPAGRGYTQLHCRQTKPHY